MSDDNKQPEVNDVQARKEREAFMSQWELTKTRFLKHKPAVIAMWILGFLYTMAILAEFVAPYTPEWQEVNHIKTRPQTPKFNLEYGWHVYATTVQQDPVTTARSYYADKDHVIPLSFFAKGEPFKLWGLIPMDRHLFGVDAKQYEKIHGQKMDPKKVTFYLLGSDKYGRDIFTRIVYGSRISLSVGIIGIAITFTLGLTLGGLSGYFSGTYDLVFQRVTEIIGGIPRLPLWLTVGAAVPLTMSPLLIYFCIVTVLSLVGWCGLARMIRSKLLALREEEYALAARLMGASHLRIIFRHLLPGFTSQIIVSLTMTVPAMILGETSLSFLGLGLRPPVVSWGVILQDCMNMEAVRQCPWFFAPAFMIVITVLCFNFMGDGLRDAADPYAS